MHLIKKNPNICGLQSGRHTYKVSLFADNLLLTLTQPIISLPNVLFIWNSYSQISNFGINKEKSVALNMSLPSSTLITLKSLFKFTWATKRLDYLGILLAYKVINKWYLVPFRLDYIFPGHACLCFRGCQTTGDVLYKWWTSPIFGSFWSRVFRLLYTLFRVPIPKEPWLAHLHFKPSNITKN